MHKTVHVLFVTYGEMNLVRIVPFLSPVEDPQEE